MDNKLVNKLAILIEKIGYLYRNIRRGDGTIKKLEMALLKQYVLELYDGLMELEKDASDANMQNMLDHLDKSKLAEIDALNLEKVEEKVAALQIKLSDDIGDKIQLQKEGKIDFLSESKEKLETFKEKTENKAHDVLVESKDKLDDAKEKLEEAKEKAENKAHDFLVEAKDKIYDVKENLSDKVNSITSEISTSDWWRGAKENISDIVSKMDDLKEAALEKANNFINDSADETLVMNKEINIEKPNNNGIEEEIIENNLQEFDSDKTQILDDIVKNKSTSFEEWGQNKAPIKQVVLDEDETVAMNLNDIMAKQKNIKEIKANELINDTSSDTGRFAIDVNQRIAFVNQLFSGDPNAFSTTMSELSKSKGYIEALTYINLNVRYDYKWKDDDPVVRTFLDMIKKRFLG